MTTKQRQSSRQHDDEEMQEPEAESVSGEVADLASDPAQKESISVLANKPEKLAPPLPPAKLGEVMDGASDDVDLPPSVIGTSFGHVVKTPAGGTHASSTPRRHQGE